ncbi:hypothetical protein D8770_08895 [Methylobacterium sp. DB1607]|nr:hypothetical protein [Methylobacterium sp. DB1607]
MAKNAAKPSINLAGPNLRLPQGGQVSVFHKGTDLYEAARINGTVELAAEDGTKLDATVQTMQVGALIDLIGSYGPQNVYTYGRPYSALGLLQALTDASTDDVVDVTKLYTVVVVTTPMPAPIMPGAPAV